VRVSPRAGSACTPLRGLPTPSPAAQPGQLLRPRSLSRRDAGLTASPLAPPPAPRPPGCLQLFRVTSELHLTLDAVFAARGAAARPSAGRQLARRRSSSGAHVHSTFSASRLSSRCRIGPALDLGRSLHHAALLDQRRLRDPCRCIAQSGRKGLVWFRIVLPRPAVTRCPGAVAR
jgi:hypothetical protein